MTQEAEEDELAALPHLQSISALTAELIAYSLLVLPSPTEDHAEAALLVQLCSLLDAYQPAPYLLDPSLETLLHPVLEKLREFICQPLSAVKENLRNPRVARLARLVYFYTKVRGGKTVLRLFPHAVTDLGALLSLFAPPYILEDSVNEEGASWELRYVLLLWLSLVVMLPFSFEGIGQQYEASTSRHPIEAIGFHYLELSSKERDAAVILLARFYSRPDCSLDPFLSLVETTLSAPDPSILLVTSLLETLSSLLLLCSPRILLQLFPRLYRLLALTGDNGNPVVKGKGRFRMKLVGRIALLRLTGSTSGARQQASAEGADVPEEVEVLIQELLEALSDSESSTRHSSSKYLARIAGLLPASFASQIFEAILETFDGAPQGKEDAWQGACLAVAEFSRRGLVPREPETVDKLIECVIRALHHDVQHLSQSLGTPVRDAAAYALWSLARVLPPSFVGEAQALKMAEHLVCVTLFDREIQIRRAAGAAWQEAVGRWGLFPHGIELLSHLDFFTVGPRARAFLEAAPFVATYAVYRGAIVHQLAATTLVHYDPEMRLLGATALERILRLDAPVLVPPLLADLKSGLQSKDTAKRHGTILSLGALAAAVEELDRDAQAQVKTEVFSSILTLTPPAMSAHGSKLLISSILFAIEKSCTASNLAAEPSWWKFVEWSWKYNDESVQAQAAATVRSVSKTIECSKQVTSLIAALNSPSAVQQQAAALILGQIDYSSLNSHLLPSVVDRLILFAGASSPTSAPRPIPAKGKASSIEGKRNGVQALATLITSTGRLGQERVSSAFDVILAGFTDYTIDQRGDVGSWVRLASIFAAGKCIDTLGSDDLNQERVDLAIGALLKQGVERLDGVREAAGRTLDGLVRGQIASPLKGFEAWDSSPSPSDLSDWRNFAWAAEKLFPLFDVKEYRSFLLEGTVLGVTPHSTGTAFLDYALSLPLHPSASQEANSSYCLIQLFKDLYDLGKRNFSSNRLFLPCLTTLGLLLESGMMDDWTEEDSVTSLKPVLLLATRSVAQIKSWPRLCGSVKITICLLANPILAPLASSKVPLFLDHPILALRQHTAEELYAASINWEGEVAEEVQNVLSETSWAESTEGQITALRSVVEGLAVVFPSELAQK